MDGKAHALASIALAPACAAAVYAATADGALAAVGAAGCLAGIPMTPDLDQEGISWVEWKIVNWTLGAGHLWLAVWHVYAKVIPHRHWLSHAPVVGTLVRVAYLAAWAAGIAAALGHDPLAIAARVPVDVALVAVAGLAVSDAAHWLMDR